MISTGDLLREAVKDGSELGAMARRFMNAGQLVPDGVMLGLIGEVLGNGAARGFILDGFPRTIAQAEGLDALLAQIAKPIEQAIALDVPEDVLVRRISGRRVCARCGTNQPFAADGTTARVGAACPNCGGVLTQRADDREDTVRRRLAVYREQTAPLVAYYERQGKLTRVNGDQTEQAVADALHAALGT